MYIFSQIWCGSRHWYILKGINCCGDGYFLSFKTRFSQIHIQNSKNKKALIKFFFHYVKPRFIIKQFTIFLYFDLNSNRKKEKRKLNFWYTSRHMFSTCYSSKIIVLHVFVYCEYVFFTIESSNEVFSRLNDLIPIFKPIFYT